MAVLEKEAGVDLQEKLIRRAWEDERFAELLRTNPRVAIAEETGIELPDDLDIHVHQEGEHVFHLVIPGKPGRSATAPFEPMACACPVERAPTCGTSKKGVGLEDLY